MRSPDIITRGRNLQQRLRAHGGVSERFHSELFQEPPGLLAKLNVNRHEPRLWAKTKHFMRREFS